MTAKPMRLGYHSLYCDGLSPNARFPRERYPKLKTHIDTHHNASSVQWFTPRKATVHELSDVHCTEYIHRFIEGTLTPKEKRQIGLRPWNPEIVDRTLHLTGGSIEAMHSAIEVNGYAGNLAGGTHHAYRDHGAGYCIFNDIVIAAIQAIEMGCERVSVLDLDVHQGDGTASICAEMPNIQTISIHCEQNYPFRKQQSDLDIPLQAGTNDQEYWQQVEHALEMMTLFNPDAIIYQAGVDGLHADRLGKFNLTRQGLQRRNQLVFDCVDALKLPCLVLMGGGYAEPIEPTVECLADLFLEAAHRHINRQDSQCIL